MSNIEVDKHGFVWVQFMPCGHDYKMSLNELKERVPEQIKQIEDGVKLDAPILPSDACEDCIDDRKAVNRMMADLDMMK